MPTSDKWPDRFFIIVLTILRKNPFMYFYPETIMLDKALFPNTSGILNTSRATEELLNDMTELGLVFKDQLYGWPAVYGLTDKGIEYLANYEKGTHNDVR